jgi:hypothetical protein
VALGTLGLLLAVHECLKLVLAFFADVLKDGHDGLFGGSGTVTAFILRSICGFFSNFL